MKQARWFWLGVLGGAIALGQLPQHPTTASSLSPQLLTPLGVEEGWGNPSQENSELKASFPHPFPILANQTPLTGSICPAQLQPELDRITNQATLRRARWGVLVQTLSTPQKRQTLYARDAQQYFIPASNAKILTTAAALRRLGANFRIRTSIYQVKATSDQLNLRLVGRGDPSLTDQQLTLLAKQLQQKGIRRINQLMLDDRYFRGSPLNPNWEWEDIQAGYGAPVNALILNQNSLGLKLVPQALDQPLRVEWEDPQAAAGWSIQNQSVTVAPNALEFVEVGRDMSRPVLVVKGQLWAGSEPEDTGVSVLDPLANFAPHLKRVLAAHQIQVDQILWGAVDAAPNQTELAAVESPSLSTLLIEANQQSNNLYAESILRTLGTQQVTAKTDSSAEAGLAAIADTLTALGVDANSYALGDGSGLSRHNLVSPEALVQTLQGIAASPQAEIYRASLAVGGVSGTLRNRFRDTPAQGLVQGKSGGLSGVAALSGYLRSPNYEPLVFSIIINQSDQSGAVLRRAIDDMVLALTRLRSCN
ncbi:MAG: D-alanyl-D-alanine carboxypeptidase/D-alanyl-D-alanine-endopeptidase [Leptolyngbyaceae bacterium]|nr:D-alanyl-D-alanine carboxypeptidase/D-alanyl-D-alanine-endopeptidase [Leptolyngbyaceae bacterium]